jgi:hypothetical protein
VQDRGFGFSHLLIDLPLCGTSSSFSSFCVGVNLFDGGSSPHRRCVL